MRSEAPRACPPRIVVLPILRCPVFWCSFCNTAPALGPLLSKISVDQTRELGTPAAELMIKMLLVTAGRGGRGTGTLDGGAMAKACPSIRACDLKPSSR